jgi:hypothetical protein
MDRNDGSPEGASPAAGTGTNATPGGNPASAGGSGMTGASADGDGRFADRAREIAGSAKDRLADVGANARERATHLRSNLADALESSADKLRRRAGEGGGQLSGAVGSTTIPLADEERMGQVAGKVAGGMDATAEWIRDLDVEGMKHGIERQVKEHPGRTLLIAIGLGYLIGKAFRR